MTGRRLCTSSSRESQLNWQKVSLLILPPNIEPTLTFMSQIFPRISRLEEGVGLSVQAMYGVVSTCWRGSQVVIKMTRHSKGQGRIPSKRVPISHLRHRYKIAVPTRGDPQEYRALDRVGGTPPSIVNRSLKVYVTQSSMIYHSELHHLPSFE
jgi:hypothetical protein